MAKVQAEPKLWHRSDIIIIIGSFVSQDCSDKGHCISILKASIASTLHFETVDAHSPCYGYPSVTRCQLLAFINVVVTFQVKHTGINAWDFSLGIVVERSFCGYHAYN